MASFTFAIAAATVLVITADARADGVTCIDCRRGPTPSSDGSAPSSDGSAPSSDGSAPSTDGTSGDGDSGESESESASRWAAYSTYRDQKSEWPPPNYKSEPPPPAAKYIGRTDGQGTVFDRMGGMAREESTNYRELAHHTSLPGARRGGLGDTLRVPGAVLSAAQPSARAKLDMAKIVAIVSAAADRMDTLFTWETDAGHQIFGDQFPDDSDAVDPGDNSIWGVFAYASHLHRGGN